MRCELVEVKKNYVMEKRKTQRRCTFVVPRRRTSTPPSTGVAVGPRRVCSDPQSGVRPTLRAPLMERLRGGTERCKAVSFDSDYVRVVRETRQMEKTTHNTPLVCRARVLYHVVAGRYITVSRDPLQRQLGRKPHDHTTSQRLEGPNC